CVRDRPAARDWLALQVLRPDPLAGFRPEEVGLLWKYLARAGGSAVLEVVRAVAPDAAALARLARPDARAVPGVVGGRAGVVAGAAVGAVAALVRPPAAPPAQLQPRVRRKPAGPGPAAPPRPAHRPVVRHPHGRSGRTVVAGRSSGVGTGPTV